MREKPWGIAFGYKPSRTKRSSKLNFKTLQRTLTPFEAFSKIHKHHSYSYLLESMKGPKKLAQYSFIGFDPQSLIRVKDGEITFTNRDGNASTEAVNDPLFKVKEFLQGRTLPFTEIRFIGGAVGYVSYDTIRYWERLPKITRDDLNFPDIELAVYDDGIVFNHRSRTAFYYYSGEDRFKEFEEVIDNPVDIQPLKYTKPKINLSKDRFEDSIARAKEYIASGDILQVVLSKRYEFSIDGDLLNFYRSLRRINPSPYMYFLKMKEHQIVGSSPEMLVRVVNDIVETYPIAGTRPRVEDKEENRVLAKELLNDPKERAEHVMLVDLARNDVGKISQFGSVHVPQFMEVHEYSHVQHIVSKVVGKLRPQCDSYDVLRGVFPAGTVSGAPKVRAMEIIEEAEPTRRGPYAGAVGYFSFNGNTDFAITIRTLIANKKRAYIQVGAGIVADSIPEKEWFETNYKAQALMRALETARGEQI